MVKRGFMYLALVCSLLFSACQNEIGHVNPTDNNTISLTRSADVYATSNGYDVSLLNANVNGNLWYQEWDRPTNVTEDEIAKITELMSTPRPNAVNDIHIDWENYWVQQVYTGETTYEDGYGQNIGAGSSHMNHLLAYSSKEKKVVSWWDEATGGPVYELVDKTGDPYEHINNFNSGSNSTVYTDDETGENYYGTTLMTDMYAEGVVDQFGYHNSTDSKNHFEYIIVEMDGNYYICFDFYATHPEGQDANKNMDVERDWVFNDWIVKISPAYLKGTTPEVTPDPEEPTLPDGPVVSPSNPKITDHVEINLEIEEHLDWLASHLSIHVRANTDVQVFIPVPVEYYCAADDLAIVQKHLDDFMIHGGPEMLEYNIDGTIVTLSVEYMEEGILVTTDGITEELINKLYGLTGDGLTFEIWNYYNPETTELNKEVIQVYLNKSTVKFLDNDPSMYINAYYFDDDHTDVNPWDCSVTPSPAYGNYTLGWWYNGAPYNRIYVTD